MIEMSLAYAAALGFGLAVSYVVAFLCGFVTGGNVQRLR